MREKRQGPDSLSCFLQRALFEAEGEDPLLEGKPFRSLWGEPNDNPREGDGEPKRRENPF